jgi:hypothetical protein
MLSGSELLYLRSVAKRTGIRSWNRGIRYILSRFVLITMAYGTVNVTLAVLAQLPISNDVGCNLFVAINTDLC